MDIRTETIFHDDDQTSSIDESLENTDLHTPECPIQEKPFVGRSFPTLEGAIECYENYGKQVGFDTRKCGSKKIDNVMSAAQKRKRIEDFYGVEASEDVHVHPPEVVSTKGSRATEEARQAKAKRQAQKPERQCKKCLKWGHHDKRNCDRFHEKERRRARRELAG